MGRLFGSVLKRAGCLLGAVACWVAGCRGYTAVCEGDACGAEALGGAGHASMYFGGSGAGEGGEPGGAAGGPEPAVCARDADCADSLSCNGDEHCRAGKCAAGEPVPCELGTRCFEQGGAPECRYETPSPWLLIEDFGRLWGLPVRELGQREMALVGEVPVTRGALGGWGDLYFSPDHRRLWAHFYTDDVYEMQLYELLTGAGVPGPLHLVKDVPSRGSFDSPYFSPDSRRALVEDGYSGAYLFQLDAADPSRYTTLLAGRFEHDASDYPRFCRDSSLLLMPTKPSQILQLTAGKVESTALPAGRPWVAPDGSTIVLMSDQATELVECAAGLGRVTLSPRAWGWVAFSDDSAFVLLADTYGESTHVYSLRNPAAPVEVFACPTCKLEFWPGGGYLELRAADDLGDGIGARSMYELHGDSPALPVTLFDSGVRERAISVAPRGLLLQDAEEALPLGEGGATSVGSGGEGGLASFAQTREFSVVFLDDPQTIHPLLRDGSLPPGELKWIDFDLGRALVRRMRDEAYELWLLRFDREPFREELVASLEGAPDLVVSPDGSGVAAWSFSPDLLRYDEVTWIPFDTAFKAVKLQQGTPVFGPVP